MKTAYDNVDRYIQSFPAEVQQLLESIRAIIKKQAPGVAEKIAYGMPAYKLHNKPLVYFAAFKKHIGFYGTPSAQVFAGELSGDKQGRGSVQFPLDQPLPLTLIERMVSFRAKELSEK